MKFEKRGKYVTKRNEVSVPLRGYGFEMLINDAEYNDIGGFRPLAGIWF